ncbi:MAG: hypothetical protein QW507_01340 [Candidatus Nanoarchaeia archaeon]|nr:hypothetical protein [Candidatus Haiyanarchaeum thermophilum]MCW1303189.1 hypothetical protein [Candidatus Haiyanarchaeum thermophilum]MCW1303855.1 hypothetical protein [Candidatus Haiyanarchaeum thermophilum]MCW1306529.1 hypothetical protein [Candidatus Haiyanarchaeum thermophilum]MCW1306942.1 hypothetical protein [Candidatus Haiyanarchaeum thermophilum]
MEITCLEHVKGIWDLLENKRSEFSLNILKGLEIGKYAERLGIELDGNIIQIKCKNSSPESLFKLLLNFYKINSYELTLSLFSKGRREIVKRVSVDVDPIMLKHELILEGEELRAQKISTAYFDINSEKDLINISVKRKEDVRRIFLELAKEFFPFLRVPTFTTSIKADIIIEIVNKFGDVREGNIKVAFKLNNSPFGVKVGNFSI